MLQSIDQALRSFSDVLYLSVDHIILEHCDDLIIRFYTVNHSKTADRPRVYEEVPMCHCLFGKNADIYGVAIALNTGYAGPNRTELSDQVTAVCLWDKTVGSWAKARKPLRPVQPEVPVLFVQLVLYNVSRNNFYKGVYSAGSLRSRVHPVPGMRLEKRSKQLVKSEIRVSHFCPFKLSPAPHIPERLSGDRIIPVRIIMFFCADYERA